MSLSYDEQLTELLQVLMGRLRVPFSKQSLRFDFSTHPESPSLLAVSEILRERGVENAAMRLNAAQLPNIDGPVLTFMGADNASPALITAVRDGQVSYQLADGRLQKKAIDSFAENWSGITLITDVSEKAVSVNDAKIETNDQKKALNQYALLGLAVVIAVGLMTTTPVWYEKLIIASYCVGMIVCVLITLSEVQSIEIIDNICKKSENTNCGAVINSPAATLFGWLKVSDVGLVYFSAGVISLCVAFVSSQGSQLLPSLALLSVLGLPYTVFSVVYQYRVIRQ